MQTLSMRDAMTARHSAAVARYAREVARLLGLSEREQDLIHTAALLHDIGKFIFPDSILFADRKLTDDEWETVKLHPEQGAKLVRRIEGYGPVADIISATTSASTAAATPTGIAGEADPARLADHRRRRHLRRDDVARLLPAAGQLARPRSPSCGASPAPSSTRWSSSAFVEIIESGGGLPPHRRGRLRARARVREAGRGLRHARAPRSPRRTFDSGAASEAEALNENERLLALVSKEKWSNQD